MGGSWAPELHNAAAKRHYYRHHDRMLHDRAAYRAFLAIWKHAAGCKDCGYRKCVEALEFDHVRGVKSFNISSGKRSMAAIMAEIAKCEVVCANCHRERTMTRRAV